MKQHITPEQLQELSEEQKERLRRWWVVREGGIMMHNWHALSFLMERAKENQAPCPTLREVLEEWLLLELLDNDPLPELDGISFSKGSQSSGGEAMSEGQAKYEVRP